MPDHDDFKKQSFGNLRSFAEERLEIQPRFMEPGSKLESKKLTKNEQLLERPPNERGSLEKPSSLVFEKKDHEVTLSDRSKLRYDEVVYQREGNFLAVVSSPEGKSLAEGHERIEMQTRRDARVHRSPLEMYEDIRDPDFVLCVKISVKESLDGMLSTARRTTVVERVDRKEFEARLAYYTNGRQVSPELDELGTAKLPSLKVE